MESENNNVIEMFDRLRWPTSILISSISFSVGGLIYDLIKFYWLGYPLRESTLGLTALMGVVSIISLLVMVNRINRIKKSLS